MNLDSLSREMLLRILKEHCYYCKKNYESLEVGEYYFCEYSAEFDNWSVHDNNGFCESWSDHVNMNDDEFREYFVYK